MRGMGRSGWSSTPYLHHSLPLARQLGYNILVQIIPSLLYRFLCKISKAISYLEGYVQEYMWWDEQINFKEKDQAVNFIAWNGTRYVYTGLVWPRLAVTLWVPRRWLGYENWHNIKLNNTIVRHTHQYTAQTPPAYDFICKGKCKKTLWLKQLWKKGDLKTKEKKERTSALGEKSKGSL